jgi:hypothetical protein
VRELSFFPGMDITGREKMRIFLRVLRVLAERFQLVSMSRHADAILRRGALRERAPDWSVEALYDPANTPSTA